MLRAAGLATKSELELLEDTKDALTRQVHGLTDALQDATSSSKRSARPHGNRVIDDSDGEDSDDSAEESAYEARSYRGTAAQIGEEEEDTEWESGVLAVSFPPFSISLAGVPCSLFWK